MNRRNILTSLGTITALSGCLNSPRNSVASTTDTSYETCSNRIVSIASLPEDAHTEVESALVESVYESDEPLVLDDVIDIETTYLSGNEVYFQPHLTTVSTRTRLHLEEVKPIQTELLAVSNDTGNPVTGQLVLLHDDEVMAESAFDLASDETTTLIRDKFTFGDYTLTIDTNSWDKTVEFRYNESKFFPQVILDSSGINIIQDDITPPQCEWNDDGDLIST